MSFVVEPGQKVALVGSTGCGKSTCMQLLQRMYTPLDGQILIDDIPIEDYDVNYLRSRIVIVDQHTVLFNASIRDNIAYGVDVSDEEIIQALVRPGQCSDVLLDVLPANSPPSLFMHTACIGVLPIYRKMQRYGILLRKNQISS